MLTPNEINDRGRVIVDKITKLQQRIAGLVEEKNKLENVLDNS